MNNNKLVYASVCDRCVGDGLEMNRIDGHDVDVENKCVRCGGLGVLFSTEEKISLEESKKIVDMPVTRGQRTLAVMKLLELYEY